MRAVGWLAGLALVPGLLVAAVRGPVEEFEAYDTNGDGLIQLEEARAELLLERRFAEADTDADDALDRREYRRIAPTIFSREAVEARLGDDPWMTAAEEFVAFDDDADGYIEPGEARDNILLMRHFADADTNADGVLDVQEYFRIAQRGFAPREEER